MSKKISFLISLGLCLVLAMAGYAKKPVKDPPPGKSGKGGKDISATFRDCTAGGDVDGGDCGPPAEDRIKSDGGPYATVGDGVNFARISSKNFTVQLDDDGVRQFFFDFTGCVSGSGCTPASPMSGFPDPGASLFSIAPSKDSVSLLEMPFPGSPQDVVILFQFQALDPVDGVDKLWTVIFDPIPPISNPEICVDSTFASLTRTGEDTWVFEAGPSPDDVACLYTKAERGAGDKGFHGFHSMPFRITVERLSGP